MLSFSYLSRKAFFIALFSLALIPQQSFAKESFSDFNSGSFYNTDKVRQFFTLGGGYKSDYNSSEYEILSGYKYRSKKFLHEIDFLHEVSHASTTTKPMRKTEELYDFEASSRMMLKESPNYLNLYNRIQYDEYSTFYYDVSSAVGLGRLFFDEKFEGSLNLGYSDVKNFNSEIILIGILKGYFDITDSIKLSTRGLIKKKEQTYDEEIKNILSFKIKENLFFEIIHKYERNRYVTLSKKEGEDNINRVKRESFIRFKYNF